MKTGIVTFHSAHNFGASLQTWALQKKLRDLGEDPVIVNYRPEAIEALYHPLHSYSGMKKQIVHLGKILKRSPSLKRSKKYDAFIERTFNLTKEYHTYEELKNAGIQLDACIVGSDQVWNTQHTGGYDPAYMLEFLDKGIRRISYAASVGTDYLLPDCQKEFERALKDFSYVSVREESARPLIQELTDIPVETVVDPTLLLDQEDYEKLRTPVGHKEKYILVYMMEKNTEVIKFANYMSKLLGLPIVQRRPDRYFQNELDPCYVTTPDEFLDYVKEAECVITNSFHGTVFSIIYEKPFMAMLHSDTGSRTKDLLKLLQLEDHLLAEGEAKPDFGRFLMKDRGKTQKLIEKYRGYSLEFLKKALTA
ncbi:MAG: polysaccharide pyruvyl transferase family protein [Ruminococcus sp.]